jgi:hypothetical protein
VFGATQAPQLDTVLGMPQLSLLATIPQFFARRAQKAMSVSGAHAAGAYTSNS